MNCIYCKEIINPLRIKALPTAKTCVECSTTGPKRGISGVFGSGDHTWNELTIMEPDEDIDWDSLKKAGLDELFTGWDEIEDKQEGEEDA